MSLFLMIFLSTLASWGIVSLIFIACLIVAVIEINKKKEKKQKELLNQFNNQFGGFEKWMF